MGKKRTKRKHTEIKNNYSNLTRDFNKFRDKYVKQGYSVEASVIRTIHDLYAKIGSDNLYNGLNTCLVSSFEQDVAIGYFLIVSSIPNEIAIAIKGIVDFSMGLYWPLKKIKAAAKHLENAEKEKPKSATLHKLLIFCYRILFDNSKEECMIKKFNQNYEQQTSYDKALIEFIHDKFLFFETIRNTEFYIKENLGIKKITRELLSIIEKNPRNVIVIILLIHIFTRRSQFADYVKILEIWTRYNPWPAAHEALGRCYFLAGEYRKASECFRMANMLNENNPRSPIYIALGTYSLGLRAWFGRNPLRMVNIAKAQEYFDQSAIVVYMYNIQPFEKLKQMSYFLRLGVKCFLLFSKSKSLRELREGIQELYTKLTKTFPRWKLFDHKNETPGTIGFPASSLIFFVQCYLYYLGSALNIHEIRGQVQKILKDSNQTECFFWKKNFNVLKRIFELNFSLEGSKFLLEGMKVFKRRINNQQPDQISLNQQKSIIKEVNNLVSQFTQRLILEEEEDKQEECDKLKQQLEIIESEIKRGFEENKEYLIKIGGSIANLKGSRTVSEVPSDKQASDIFRGKKMKVLTNIDQEGQEHEGISEIIFGEKRVKFLPKGEITNRRNMAVRLLQYFVLRRQIHWLYGYIVFKAWHKRRIGDHKKAFSKIISQLKGPRKGIFAENDLPLTIEPVLFHRGTYELEGDYISNIDILADIFKKGTNIDELVKKINNLREEEFELIKYFLRELKDDYESGCRAILNAKKNNHIAYWDTVAERPFLEIQCDKTRMKDVLIKLGEKMEEQVNKDFMVWQNMINHIKSHVIDGYISRLNRQQLLNEIEVDDDFKPIYTELLKESEDIRVENQIGIDAWHRLHLETIGGIELDVRRFGTTEGIIKFIRSKTKRKLHGLKYQKTDEEESYERYKRDFKKAERDFEQKINRLPTYEDIGKELVKHYHWTAERFSDFLALKEEKDAFRHIEEKDNNTKDTKTKGI